MNANFSNIKELLKLVKSLSENIPSMLKKKILPFIILLNSALVIIEISYELKYDVNDLVSGIKELNNFKED